MRMSHVQMAIGAVLLLAIIGCSQQPITAQGGAKDDRVILRVGQPLPTRLEKAVQSSSSVRLVTEPGRGRIDQHGAYNAVRSILAQWDEIPLTSVSRPLLDRYVGLQAEGYDAGGSYAFQLLKGGKLSDMVLIVRKDRGAVYLLNDQQHSGS